MIVSETTARLPSGVEVVLRSPVASDAGPMLTFLRQLFRESFRNLNHGPSYFDAATEEQEAALLDGAAKHPASFYLSAWVREPAAPGGDSMVMVANAGVIAARATLKPHCADCSIAVLERFQGQGLGRALFSRAVSEADRAGLWNLNLSVRTFNEAAIRLYEGLGFVRIGTVRAAAKLPEGYADEHIYQRISPPPEIQLT